MKRKATTAKKAVKKSSTRNSSYAKAISERDSAREIYLAEMESHLHTRKRLESLVRQHQELKQLYATSLEDMQTIEVMLDVSREACLKKPTSNTAVIAACRSRNNLIEFQRTEKMLQGMSYLASSIERLAAQLSDKQDATEQWRA